MVTPRCDVLKQNDGRSTLTHARALLNITPKMAIVLSAVPANHNVPGMTAGFAKSKAKNANVMATNVSQRRVGQIGNPA